MSPKFNDPTRRETRSDLEAALAGDEIAARVARRVIDGDLPIPEKSSGPRRRVAGAKPLPTVAIPVTNGRSDPGAGWAQKDTACRAPGCDRSSLHSSGLCTHHLNKKRSQGTVGKPTRTLTAEQIATARQMRSGMATWNQIARRLGATVATVKAAVLNRDDAA